MRGNVAKQGTAAYKGSADIVTAENDHLFEGVIQPSQAAGIDNLILFLLPLSKIKGTVTGDTLQKNHSCQTGSQHCLHDAESIDFTSFTQSDHSLCIYNFSIIFLNSRIIWHKFHFFKAIFMCLGKNLQKFVNLLFGIVDTEADANHTGSSGLAAFFQFLGGFIRNA